MKSSSLNGKRKRLKTAFKEAIGAYTGQRRAKDVAGGLRELCAEVGKVKSDQKDSKNGKKWQFDSCSNQETTVEKHASKFNQKCICRPLIAQIEFLGC